MGTLVERTSRLLMLPYPKPAGATNVLQVFSDKLLSIAAPIRLSMTYDQGREMALHKKLTEKTGVAAYFFDQPAQPGQRGSNASAFGLAPLVVYSQLLLNAPQHSTLSH